MWDTSETVVIQWWRHQMEKFPRCWPYVRGIHRSPVNSPHKGQWRRALMFSLICLDKRLSKQSRRRWFETPSRSLWRHSDVLILCYDCWSTSTHFFWHQNIWNYHGAIVWSVQMKSVLEIIQNRKSLDVVVVLMMMLMTMITIMIMITVVVMLVMVIMVSLMVIVITKIMPVTMTKNEKISIAMVMIK